MPECVHEMPEGTCGYCHRKPADDRPLASGPTIDAHNKSPCSCECGEWIEVGDSITYSNEADGWCLTKHVRVLEMP
jgi:hypothetical protein